MPASAYPAPAGQELHGAKPPSHVQQLRDSNAMRLRHLMLLVVLAKECSAGHVERLYPRLRPSTARACDRLYQHRQALRVCEQGFQSFLAGFVNEFFRVIDFQIVAQDFENVLIGKRIKTQDHDLSVARNDLQIISVVGPEPVGLSAGKPEPRTTQLVELSAYSVQWCASVRRSRPLFVEAVNKQRRVVPFRVLVDFERDEVPGGDWGVCF